MSSFAASSGSVGPSPYDGHHFATGQTPQAGLREWQIRRPCQISRCDSPVQSRFSNSDPTSCSTLTGSSSVVQPNRRDSRPKWVSTVMPGTPKALPRTTFAVLRPTPGQRDEVLEPCRAPRRRTARSSAWPSVIRLLVFARKKPVGRIIVLHLGAVGGGVVRGGRIAPEQRRRDLVDLLVGALRGQHRGHEQLQRGGEVELAVRVGIGLP